MSLEVSYICKLHFYKVKSKQSQSTITLANKMVKTLNEDKLTDDKFTY